MGKNEGRTLVTDNFKNYWKYEEEKINSDEGDITNSGIVLAT